MENQTGAQKIVKDDETVQIQGRYADGYSTLMSEDHDAAIGVMLGDVGRLLRALSTTTVAQPTESPLLTREQYQERRSQPFYPGRDVHRYVGSKAPGQGCEVCDHGWVHESHGRMFSAPSISEPLDTNQQWVRNVTGDTEYWRQLTQEADERNAKKRVAPSISEQACDHCSADLNGVQHVLCEKCYRKFAGPKWTDADFDPEVGSDEWNARRVISEQAQRLAQEIAVKLGYKVDAPLSEHSVVDTIAAIIQGELKGEDEREVTIEEAAKAVYRKYGTDLAAFWRDAWANQVPAAKDKKQ